MHSPTNALNLTLKYFVYWTTQKNNYGTEGSEHSIVSKLQNLSDYVTFV